MEAECRLPAFGWLGKFGPYALIELVLPGGTLIALVLLWLRRRRLSAAATRSAA